MPSQTAELLSSQRLHDVIEMVRHQYDFVLLDTPALWEVTDPSVIAPRVDGVILAMQIRKNGGPKVQGAKEMLDRLGARVLSVVVNAVRRYPSTGSPSLAHYPEDAEYRP
jgi:Mrp family chromosome partitioning ATPase